MKMELLKNIQIKPGGVSFQPLMSCCGPSVSKVKTHDEVQTEFQGISWFEGVIDSPAGPVPRVSCRITARERIDQMKSRISSFRMNFSLKPGLYAVGKPDAESDIFVTANYRLSFDHLRQALAGVNAWILVLDTAGINVWCAAGKGSFGTDELVNRIRQTNIEKCVNHRRVILPQLGAPGVDSAFVKKQTGFRVCFGPVRAEDVKRYVSDGYTADRKMRRVKFGFADRAVLIPMEIFMVKGVFIYFILAALVYSALTPEGLIFREIFTTGPALLTAGGLAVFAGAVVTPLLLPWLPFRSFILKGGIAGAAVLTGFEYFTGMFGSSGVFFQAGAVILFTMAASFIAFQFTGASTYTSLSGVQKELKISLPVYLIGIAASAVLLVLSKISEWGYL